ncbi:hypothetical protein ACQEVZ_28805 [Dactylosporangium sp. CA-152071]|uniref:hypothetical protein n=1 Tax=Dactylosporangium sp. CA-152071 TaxID=3239933 RepID=UPI003D8E6EDA
MRQRAPFRQLVEQILAECATHGIDVSRAAVEDMVAGRVRDMAATLRVREDTVVRSYLSTIDPAAFVAALRQAGEQGARELADTPPAILDLDSVGRLVASLGQAVRCVSLNHHTIAGGERGKWEAVGVLDNAGDGLTLIGAALEHVEVGEGRVSVLLSDEAVVRARRGLAQTVQNLQAGVWSFDHGPDVDVGVAERMAADLALLPPA